MNSPIARRIAGTATLLAVVAMVAVGFRMRFSRPAGTTDVTLQVPQSGIGLQLGTDVKVRGVTVGRVYDVALDEDVLPTVTIRLDRGVQIPRENLEVTITPKTFFGEKQIELLYPLEAFGQPPFLEDGDVIVSNRELTEVEDVLVTLEPLLSGIDEDDLATLFDAIAALEGEGDKIARNLEVGAELARFGDDVSASALRNARLLTSFADQLAAGADEFDRLNAALPASVALLSERSAEIETNLEALSSFALTTAAWLDVEEQRFDRLLASGDVVGAFLERNVQSVPSIVEGIALFANVQSRPSPYLDDDTIYVPFKIFLDLEELLTSFFGQASTPTTTEGATDGR